MRIEYPYLSPTMSRNLATFKITPLTVCGIYSPAFQKDASYLATTGHTVAIDCGRWFGKAKTIVELNPTLRFNVLEDNPTNHTTKFIASELIYGDPNGKMQRIADDLLELAVRFQRPWSGLKLFGPANLFVVIISSNSSQTLTQPEIIEHPMEKFYTGDSDTYVISEEPDATSNIVIGENITVADMNDIFTHIKGGYTVSLFQEDDSGSTYELGIEISEDNNRGFKINFKTTPISNITEIFSPLVRYALHNSQSVSVNRKDSIIGTEYREFSAEFDKRFGRELNMFLDDFHDSNFLGTFNELVEEFISSGVSITVSFGNGPPYDIDELKEYLNTEIKKHIQVKAKINISQPSFLLTP